MMLTAEQAEDFLLRKGVLRAKLWPGGIVPYFILEESESNPEEVLPAERAETIEEAIQHWTEYSCLKFVKYDTPPERGNFLKFVNRTGCWSYIGETGKNGQLVS